MIRDTCQEKIYEDMTKEEENSSDPEESGEDEDDKDKKSKKDEQKKKPTKSAKAKGSKAETKEFLQIKNVYNVKPLERPPTTARGTNLKLTSLDVTGSIMSETPGL